MKARLLYAPFLTYPRLLVVYLIQFLVLSVDLIIQAKAGTGKTCVFALAALEMVQPNLPHLQAVVLAPTREIALQITEVIRAIGQNVKGKSMYKAERTAIAGGNRSKRLVAAALTNTQTK